MKRFIQLFFVLSFIYMVTFLLNCSELPGNPAEDTANVNVAFFNKDGNVAIIQGKSVTVGIVIRYPALTNKVRIDYGDNIKIDTLFCKKTEYSKYDTLFMTFTYAVFGKKAIEINIDLVDGTVKQAYYSLEVVQKQLTVSVDTIPKNDTIETGKQDTLIFFASTEPNGGIITFSAEAIPALDTSKLKVIGNGINAIVIFTPAIDTLYSLKCIARSGTASDTGFLQLTTYSKPVPIDTPLISVIKQGVADTLAFAVKPAKNDFVTLQLLNGSSFSSGTIKILRQIRDSIVIEFKPAEAKTYTFQILETGKYSIDTLYIDYNLTFTDSLLPVISLKNPVINGMTVYRDTITLLVKCIDESGIASVNCMQKGIPLSVIKVNDSIFSVSVNGLQIGKLDTFNFDVTDKSSNANKNKLDVLIQYKAVSVQYDGNGNTGGIVPVDTIKYSNTANVKVMSGALLVKKGYVFSGWNTSVSGDGQNYFADSMLIVGDEGIILFAKWNVVNYNIKYNLDGGSNGSNPLVYNVESPLITLANATKNGFKFGGWYADTNMTIPLSSVNKGSTGDMIFFARWITAFTVTYSGNENTSGSVPLDSNIYINGETITVLDTCNLLKNKYRFITWNTNAAGTGTSYNPGSTFNLGSANVVLYAKWILNTVNITYNKNDTAAIGLMDNQLVLYDSTLKLQSNKFTKTGYTFIGWSTSLTGNVEYTNEVDFKADKNDVTMYAKWAILDIDSNVYTEVKIGSQIWMVENFKATKYKNGSTIDTSLLKFPGNSISNLKKYGLLYYPSVIDSISIPAGWRIPSSNDFQYLVNYLSSNGYGYNGVDSAVVKSIASKTDWVESGISGTPGHSISDNNSCFFSALPVSVFVGSNFEPAGSVSMFWTTSTEGYFPLWPILYALYYNSSVLSKIISGRTAYYISIRLMRDL